LEKSELEARVLYQRSILQGREAKPVLPIASFPGISKSRQKYGLIELALAHYEDGLEPIVCIAEGFGSSVQYMSRILPETSFILIATNRFLLEDTRRRMRDDGDLDRCRVFAADPADPKTYRIAQQIGFCFSFDTLMMQERPLEVLTYVFDRLDVGSRLYISGYVQSEQAAIPKLPQLLAQFQTATGYHSLHSVEWWKNQLHILGFSVVECTRHNCRQTISLMRVALLVRHWLLAFLKQDAVSKAVIATERAVRKLTGNNSLSYVSISAKK